MKYKTKYTTQEVNTPIGSAPSMFDSTPDNHKTGNKYFWPFLAFMVSLIVGLLFFLPRIVGATYDNPNCQKVCVQSIPWCEKWQGFKCKEWGTKCLKHEWVCLPETDVTPIPSPTEAPVEPTVTPEPTQVPNVPDQPKPMDDGLGLPVCTDGNTILLPANFHVIRTGSEATLKWFQTQANSVNIFYKENGQSGWTHAVGDVPAKDFNEFTVKDLNPNLGYTFGLQQKQGCGGGETVTAVVIDPPATNKTFSFSFWEWSK